jgi:hypothetical protein
MADRSFGAVWQQTPEIADAYGRVCAKYQDGYGDVRGDDRYAYMFELALILRCGGEHGLSDAQVWAEVALAGLGERE